MQLDRTEIVIRQRAAPELLDLSLRVLRRHGLKIAAACAILGLPFLLADVLLLSWMLGEDAILTSDEIEEPLLYLRIRHAAHLIAMFVLQFPLVSLPATIFLGDQIFYESPSLKQLLGRLRSVWQQSVWVLGVCRLGLVSFALAFFVNRNLSFDPGAELFLFLGLAFALLIRAVWPFAPEILGLERCQIRATPDAPIKYSARRSGLHQSVSSDHIGRFIACGLTTMMLAAVLGTALYLAIEALTGVSELGGWYDHAILPLILWVVGLFAVVFRFLCYLDSRIRLEGWELELRLRAEGQRVLASMGPQAVETVSNPEEVPA